MHPKVKGDAHRTLTKILTDNGTQFTDRFNSKEKKPTGTHAFDQACSEAQVEHRLSPPRHPQTNGMVERFNGRISELCHQTRFKSAAELETTLMNYQDIYNNHIPQKALSHKTPIAALEEWCSKKKELFVIQNNNQTKPDNNHIPQKALGHKTPGDALEEWRNKKKELFVIQDTNRAERDTVGFSLRTLPPKTHMPKCRFCGTMNHAKQNKLAPSIAT